METAEQQLSFKYNNLDINIIHKIYIMGTIGLTVSTNILSLVEITMENIFFI